MELTAVEAAFVTGQSERTLRRHITSAYLPARKVRGVFRIDLAELRGRYVVRSDRLAELLGTHAPYAPERVRERPPAPRFPVQLPVQQPAPTRPPVTQESSASDFATHADAARWLVGHGIRSELTPKTWKEWRTTPLSKRAILGLALSLQDPNNWRITWHLVRCGDAPCVCVEMIS